MEKMFPHTNCHHNSLSMPCQIVESSHRECSQCKIVHISSYIPQHQSHAHQNHNGLVFPPFQTPNNSPVSPIQSTTPLTAAFAIPAFCVPALFLPATPSLPGTLPGLTKLLPAPVAYSDPMLGSTFSPALKLTNSANGTNHTCSPKKLAISVNDGTLGWS